MARRMEGHHGKSRRQEVSLCFVVGILRAPARVVLCCLSVLVGCSTTGSGDNIPNDAVADVDLDVAAELNGGSDSAISCSSGQACVSPITGCPSTQQCSGGQA